jgi:hypothetical protein
MNSGRTRKRCLQERASSPVQAVRQLHAELVFLARDVQVLQVADERVVPGTVVRRAGSHAADLIE